MFAWALRAAWIKLQMPAAASVCPILALLVDSTIGILLMTLGSEGDLDWLSNTVDRAPSSIGSPRGVPVPCISAPDT
jgi:hypothetical protein